MLKRKHKCKNRLESRDKNLEHCSPWEGRSNSNPIYSSYGGYHDSGHKNGLQIVAYCCEHCAYAAADLAGGLRIQYPSEIKVVQLPCTGKLDTLMVLQAIEKGIGGIMVTG